MEQIWAPWRASYISQTDNGQRKGVPVELSAWPPEEDKRCVFCNMLAATKWAVSSGMSPEEADRAALILERGPSCFVCLNRYPYSTGHVMVVPYMHLASLAGLPDGVAEELIRLAQRMETVLRDVYRPNGLNMGINLGEAAGAGIAEHLHLHVLPRWAGDTNFMTVTGDTRVMPEALGVTWDRLRITLTKVHS